MTAGVFTAMDAGINRALEGLRVCEDIFRFSVRNSVSAEFKDIRHAIVQAASFIPASQLIRARDVASDSQKFIDTGAETFRSGMGHVFRSNIRRAAESVRSLEEFSKTFNADAGASFQNIRFRLYGLEQKGWSLLVKDDLLSRFRFSLYSVLDVSFVKAESMPSAASTLIAAGARIIQLRMKNTPDSIFLPLAREISSICSGSSALFVVNDRPDIAVLSGAAGLHLGQDDMTPDEARRITGEDMLIGISAHSYEEAVKCIETSADYIAVGPVFPSVSKKGEFFDGLGTSLLREICAVT